jgi:hypothetical protein
MSEVTGTYLAGIILDAISNKIVEIKVFLHLFLPVDGRIRISKNN